MASQKVSRQTKTKTDPKVTKQLEALTAAALYEESKRKAAKKRAAEKAKKHVKPSRTPAKAAKKPDAKRFATMPDPAKQARREAKRTFAKPIVESFINAAAVTTSTPKALQVDDTLSYSDATKLMSQPEVQRAVANQRMTLAAECGITSQRIMKEYAAMGFSNMKNYAKLLTADTIIDGLEELTEEQAAAIQEITTETYFDEVEKKQVKRIKLKLYPKEVAVNKMAQHLGIKGFGGQLKDAGISRVGMKTIVKPDGTVETTALVEQLPEEELDRIIMGLEDEVGYDERTE